MIALKLQIVPITFKAISGRIRIILSKEEKQFKNRVEEVFAKFNAICLLQVQQGCNKLTSLCVGDTAAGTAINHQQQNRKIQGNDCVNSNQINPDEKFISCVTSYRGIILR